MRPLDCFAAQRLLAMTVTALIFPKLTFLILGVSIVHVGLAAYQKVGAIERTSGPTVRRTTISTAGSWLVYFWASP